MTEETQNTPPETQDTNEPPAWFKEFSERVEGKFQKFGQDFGKIREKVRSIEPREDAPAKQPESLSFDDIDAVRRLGRIENQLTSKQRARVDEISRARGFAEALSFAESVLEFAPPPSATPEVPKVTGQPRSETTGPAKTKPLSQKAFLDLKKSDPEFYRELMDDPTFDPFVLPQMTRDEYNKLRGNGIK